MRYTTDDMRNLAGPLDQISLDIGGEHLAMKEAADEIDGLRRALEICAAPYISPPCTVMEGAQYLTQEFQRRMSVAGAALNLLPSETKLSGST